MAASRDELLRELVYQTLDELVPGYEFSDRQLDLANTPERVVRAWGETLRGYDPEENARVTNQFTTFPAGEHTGVVAMGPIPFSSTCAHHLQPFVGVAHVAYIPAGVLVGLSKIPRVIDLHAARLQIQERLTSQVADYLESRLVPLALVVVTEATHGCMEYRGVKKPGVKTRCAEIRGKAWDPTVQGEMYRLLGL